MTIEATGVKRVDGAIVSVDLKFSGKSVKDLMTVLDRAMNTWEDAPQEMRELSDKLNHGMILQDYSARQYRR